MFNFEDILIVVTVLTVAAFVQGYSGFGFGIVSMTTFSFLAFDIERVSVIVTITLVAVMIILFFLTRIQYKIAWRKIVFPLCGIVIGSPLGYWFTVVYKNQPIFSLILGIVFLSFSINGFFSPHIERNIPAVFAVLFGGAAGFISGAFSTGGPPVIFYLYSQKKDPREMKSTLQAIFLVMVIYRLIIIGIGSIGYSREVLVIPLYALPIALCTLFIGHILSKRSSIEIFKKIIYALVGLVSIVIILRGARGLFMS